MIESKDTEISSLQFIKWTDLYKTEKPYQIFIDLPPDAPRTNVDFEVKDVVFRDIRGDEEAFDLDNNGFIMRTFEEVKGLDEAPSTEFIQNVYLPAVKELLKREVEGADRVEIFDWRVCLNILFSLISFTPTSGSHLPKFLVSRKGNEERYLRRGYSCW